jgi:hypothetical protein
MVVSPKTMEAEPLKNNLRTLFYLKSVTQNNKTTTLSCKKFRKKSELDYESWALLLERRRLLL